MKKLFLLFLVIFLITPLFITAADNSSQTVPQNLLDLWNQILANFKQLFPRYFVAQLSGGADRYWVGGTGNWSDAANHWAATSGGSPAVGNLPVAGDNVFFDTNSGTGTAIIDTVSVSVTNLSLNKSGFTLDTSTNGITITGNLTITAGTISGATAVTLSGASHSIIAGTATVLAPIIFEANCAVNVNSGNLTLSGAISGSGGITKTGAGQLTLSGNNTFSGGLIVKEGTAALATKSNAAGAGAIILGDTSGSANASLLGNGIINIVNPISVVSGSSGTLSITSNNNVSVSTFSGTITLNNNLTISLTGKGGLTLSGDIIGTGNITTSSTAAGGTITLSASVNNIGTITNSGAGSGAIIASAVVGGNVTGIIQNSSTSILDLTTNTGASSKVTILSGTVLYTGGSEGGGGGSGGSGGSGGVPTITYTLTTTATNGTVAKNPDQATYNSGTVVTLTATPDTGYSFSSWSGDLTGAVNPSTVTMTANKNITANFTANNLPNLPTFTPRSPVGVNLSIFEPWTKQVPFKNMALRYGYWYLKLKSTMNPEYLITPASIDENYYTRSWPSDTNLYYSFSFGDGEAFLARTFIFLYDGVADLNFAVEGHANTTFTKTREGRYVINVPSGDNSITAQVISTDPADSLDITKGHLRNIRLVEQQYEDNYLTQPYQPLFLSFLQDFSAVRFMDWMRVSIKTSPSYDFVAGATANTVTLSIDDSVSPLSVGKRIKVIHQSIAQIKTIIAYNSSTKTATVDSNWNPAIQSGDQFFYDRAQPVSLHGRFASITSSNTINLGIGVSNQDDYYNGKLILVEDGWQRRIISDYDGASRVATVSANWATPWPGVNSVNYYIYNFSQKEWSDRMTPTKLYSTDRSPEVPVETMVDIANAANVSPWFNIPAEASDNYIRQFATYVRGHLKSGLKVYLEYGNENWNSTYPGFHWTLAKGAENGTNGWSYSAHRSVEMFKIFDDVFNEPHLRQQRNGSRLVRLLPCQNAYIANCTAMMDYVGPFGNKSADYADALAVASYFGVTATELLNKTESELIAVMKQSIDDRYSATGSTYTNIKNAAARGLSTVAYEAGQEMSVSAMPSGWTAQNQANAIAKMYLLNRSPLMSQVYLKDLEYWKHFAAADTTPGTKIWMHFQDTVSMSKYGAWGLREYMTQPMSEAPKWQTVHNFASSQKAWWTDVFPANYVTNVCQENWSCGLWTTCVNGNQTRVCTDYNNCGTLNIRPNLIQSCAIAPQPAQNTAGSGSNNVNTEQTTITQPQAQPQAQTQNQTSAKTQILSLYPEIPEGFQFTKSLKFGMSSDDVKYLQIILNSDKDTMVASTGWGSSGSESIYFGRATLAAVIKFQQKYAADISGGLTLTSGQGLVGPKTIAKLNQLLLQTSTTQTQEDPAVIAQLLATIKSLQEQIQKLLLQKAAGN